MILWRPASSTPTGCKWRFPLFRLALPGQHAPLRRDELLRRTSMIEGLGEQEGAIEAMVVERQLTGQDV